MQMELMDINSRMDEGRVNINFRITGAFVYMVKVSLLLKHCRLEIYRIERPGTGNCNGMGSFLCVHTAVHVTNILHGIPTNR